MSRRELLKGLGSSSAAAWLLPQAQAATSHGNGESSLVLPVLRQPDAVLAWVGDAEASRIELARVVNRWTGNGRTVRVDIAPGERESSISLESSRDPVQRIQLRWKGSLAAGTRVLGDAWERSYGDLAWRSLEPERALPWYAMLQLAGRCAGMGVKTGIAAFAFWQVDPIGISLWLDVRNGGNGVRLGERVLHAATIVTYTGGAGESSFAATQALCRRMAEGTKIVKARGDSPVSVICGSNDWYYAYGQNTPEGILRDADLVSSLASAGGVKPFTVIDDGYQDRSRFPDMPRLAAEIRSRDVIPGIWIRPLRAGETTPANLLLPNARWKGGASEPPPVAYDPTIPEAMEAIAAVASEACGWGYQLIKHDFTTFELFGQWGSQMGASPTQGDWHFHDRSLTNAEIVSLLYRRLRSSCGEDRLVLGCNTVGHLSVGIFDASRTGDDVSGRQWERTRRTGVNTLAFRLPQHRTFFSIDADCVPITRAIPWSMTRQWLEVVASTGSVLLLSPEPGSVGTEQRDALRDAFAQCARGTASEPVDWADSRTPEQWRSAGKIDRYEWTLPGGEDPFPIGIQRGLE